MEFLTIQILLNVILLRMVNVKALKIYKQFSYIAYPILLTVIVVLFTNEVSIHKQHWGIALDITPLFNPDYHVMIVLSVIIQFLFNTQYLKLLKPKKNSI